MVTSLLHFDETLEHFADATAIYSEDGSSLSYAELASRVSPVQHILTGDKQLLCILCGLNTATIIGYLAALRAGQAVMLINADLNEEKIAHLLSRYRPEWLFEPVQQGRSYVCLADGYGLRQSHSANGPLINPDLTLLLSTSGTTGSAKTVRLNKKNLYANATSIVEYLSIDSDERAITTLPLHYSYGLSILNSHLAAGAAIVLTDESMMSRSFWDIVKQHHATSLAGVPYHYEMLLRLNFFAMDLPDLTTMTQAGGKLRPEYVQRFAAYARQTNRRFFVMYGQTEATARISFLPPDEVSNNPASIGKAIPGGKLWLQDENGELISETQQEGELVYEGSNVMMGYAARREDLAAGDKLCGKLLTGDLAVRDREGFFIITGRKKRFIKIFGNRVNLDEVEQLLKTHNFAALCAGEDNRLLIVVTDPSVQAAAGECAATLLGIHHSAVKTAVVDKFSYMASGKIDYAKTLASVAVTY
jgi:acyl-coenzyme A synthetase/AMP-(fatty) acid ligase